VGSGVEGGNGVGIDFGKRVGEGGAWLGGRRGARCRLGGRWCPVQAGLALQIGRCATRLDASKASEGQQGGWKGAASRGRRRCGTTGRASAGRREVRRRACWNVCFCMALLRYRRGKERAASPHWWSVFSSSCTIILQYRRGGA
jgi:hypothetical protein